MKTYMKSSGVTETFNDGSVAVIPGPTLYKHRSVVKRLRQLLPWRVQQALSAASYIRPVTQYVFRKILDTPPLPTDSSSPLDVLSLLDAPNVNNYLLAIKSLLLHLPTRPSVTVLSDGTLEASDVANLKRHITGIRVLTRDQVTIPESSAVIVNRWCREYPYLAKLMYLPFSTEKPFLMILDSDVMFRRPLPANFAQPVTGVAAVFNRDHDHSKYDPCFHYLEEYAKSRGIRLINDLNCGLMVWNRLRLKPLDTVEFLNYLFQRDGCLHAVAEQDAWTLLASQLPVEPLATEFLVLSNWEYNDRTHRRLAIAVHYVSGERYRRLDYLKDGLRIIRRLKYASSP